MAKIKPITPEEAIAQSTTSLDQMRKDNYPRIDNLLIERASTGSWPLVWNPPTVMTYYQKSVIQKEYREQGWDVELSEKGNLLIRLATTGTQSHD